MDYKEKVIALLNSQELSKEQKEKLENIFPELKESEDEKIRKCVKYAIDRLFLKEKIVCDVHKDDVVAWLEKQSKETSWKPSKEEMDVLYGLAYITDQYDEHKEEVITRLYQDLKREFFNGSSYENMFPNTEDGVRRRSTIQVLEYARSLDTYNQYGKADIDKNIAWLEKQGEKPTVIDIDKMVLDYSRTKDSDFGLPVNRMVMAYRQGINDALKLSLNLEKQGEQPTDKIDTKFKVGDWIVNKGQSYLIADIDYEQRRYLFEIGGYTHEQLNWEYIENADNKYHLWTINDAKDGDVLAFDDNTIVIFKDLYNATIFHSYCHIEDGLFDVSEDDMPDWWKGKGFQPATKGQRDLLLQKMKKAGYEWDAEKKELKKIETHYGIANFYAGMPVLVRDDDGEEWNYLYFSHYRKKSSDHFFAGGNPWYQCIPFDGNEHLLGTTDMCDERFINW